MWHSIQLQSALISSCSLGSGGHTIHSRTSLHFAPLNIFKAATEKAWSTPAPMLCLYCSNKWSAAVPTPDH